MKKTKKTWLTPAGIAALITASCLLLCGIACMFAYSMTAYLPLLLVGILQVVPALANLVLMLPRGHAATPPSDAPAPTEEQPDAEKKIDEEAPAAEDGAAKPARKRLKRISVKALLQKAVSALRQLWYQYYGAIIVVASAAPILSYAIYFALCMGSTARSYGLNYVYPVLMVVFFVLHIVLEKWCKHAGGVAKEAEKQEHEQEEAPTDPVKAHHSALLRSLRGASSLIKWGDVVVAIALLVRLLKFGDYAKFASILIAILFGYEIVFMLASLVVRVIRREMDTEPELSVPMPGLGGDDLGVVSYLEKNTGMTMRSLWSIHLIRNLVPYVILGVVVLLWGFSGVVKIEPHQQGALYRLGCLQEETLQPGLHMTLPWPFDSVEVYDTEVANIVTIGYKSDESSDNIWTQAHGSEEYKLLLGGGNELVSINLRVVYRIDDLKAYLSHNASPEAMLQTSAYEIVTAKTICTDLNTLLATDRSAFAQDFKEELTAYIAPYQTGLTVMDVVLESIHPPVDIADVYQKLISAGIEAERIILTARGAEQVRLIEANSRYYTTIGQAEAAKIAAIAAANASVAEFLAKVEVEEDWSAEGYDYKYHKYLQAVAAAYANGKIVILGEGVDGSNIYIGNVNASALIP